MTRSALEVVTLYNLELWNKGRLELLPELCADRMIRHDSNSVTIVTLEEQTERIRHNYEELRPTFEPVVLAGDDEYITLVWNVTGRDPNWKWCGIEVFRVVDGKIIEVWNSPYEDGRWSNEGVLILDRGGNAPTSVPAMSAAVGPDGGGFVVPLDAHATAFWLTLAFGEPQTESTGALFQHRFTWGGHRSPTSLHYQERGQAAQSLGNIELRELDIRWARSGLTNVTIKLDGTAGHASLPAAAKAEPSVRLSECTGTFSAPDRGQARVVGASVALDCARRSAAGEITLRLPAGTDLDALQRDGRLDLSWRHGDFSLTFSAEAAAVSDPRGAFTDGNDVEAVFNWTASSITAVLVNNAAVIAG